MFRSREARGRWLLIASLLCAATGASTAVADDTPSTRVPAPIAPSMPPGVDERASAPATDAWDVSDATGACDASPVPFCAGVLAGAATTENLAEAAEVDARDTVSALAAEARDACVTDANACARSSAALSAASTADAIPPIVDNPVYGPGVNIAATGLYGQGGSNNAPITCFVGVGTGTPRGERLDWRYISYTGSVSCPYGGRGNVKITLSDVTLLDVEGNRVLATAPDWGPHVVATDPTHKPGGTTGGFYTRTKDTQAQRIRIEAYVEIVTGTAGWNVVPPQCTQLSRKVARCNFTSGAFTFVPTKFPAVDGGNPGSAEASASACGQPGVGAAYSYPGGDAVSGPAEPPDPVPYDAADGAIDALHENYVSAPAGEVDVEGGCDEKDIKADAAGHRSAVCKISNRTYTPAVYGSRLSGTAEPYCDLAGSGTSVRMVVCVQRFLFGLSDKSGWATVADSCRVKSFGPVAMTTPGGMRVSSKGLRCRTAYEDGWRTKMTFYLRAAPGGRFERFSPKVRLPCTT